MATTYADASELEIRLKQIITDHPETHIHPASPSGPYVRAVMWTAHAGLIKGQVFWDTDTSRWVVRAVKVYDVLSEPSTVHPASTDAIPAAITDVISGLT